MAKDPAFLWYPGDYIAGTTEYTFEEKGAYVEILMKQFEHGGPLPEEKIKRILREKFSAIWPVICEKFKQDEHGNFYNDRLEKEREKRKNFTQSRRDNLKGKNKTHKESHMEQHTEDRMENENENRNEDEIVNEIKNAIKKEPLQNAPREISDESLFDVEQWTKDVLEGNDSLFLSMVRNQNMILNGQLDSLARDHLGKCARYNWHERMTTQQSFRLSLLNYITENLKIGKEKTNGKPKATLADINKYRTGNV